MVWRPVEAPPQLDLAGFDGDAVVAHVEAAADDLHPVAGFRVHGVGVGAFLRRVHPEVVKAQVRAIIGVEMPGGRIPGAEAVDADIPAAVEEAEPGPRRR